MKDSEPMQNISFEYDRALLNQFYVVLVFPRIPANIGATARAMLNMGFQNLIVVGEKDLLTDDAYSLARNGISVLDKAVFYDDLKEALEEINYIIGTTRRPTRYHFDILTPFELIPSLLQMAPNNKIALMFGPEDTGLHTEHLTCCNKLLRIPTASECPSINLGQAVLLTCYEIFKELSSPSKIETQGRVPDSRVVEGLFQHLEEFLFEIEYLPHESPEHTMQLFRQMYRFCDLDDYNLGLLRSLLHKTQYFIKHKSGKLKPH